VEPEGTPEQIADACVAHLAAGGRVDVMRQTGRWEPTAVCEAGAFAYHLRNGTRFALVYPDPPQPERPKVGRCGDWLPTLVGPGEPTTHNCCELPAGHAGWHRDGDTEWGQRWASNARTGDPIEPVPVPPAPETERVPWYAVDQRRRLAAFPDTPISGIRWEDPDVNNGPAYLDRSEIAVCSVFDPAIGWDGSETVEVLPLDGTDGD
jgi:hypothetical protein